MAHIYKTRNGKRVPSVTTITGVMNKPAMPRWANSIGLQGLDYDTHMKSLAGTGTCAHAMVEAFCLGTKPDLTEFKPDQIAVAENSLIKFMYWAESVKFEPILMEAEFVSEKYLYGGRIDMVGKVNGVPTLVDLKTSKAIYDEHKTQVAGGYGLLCDENSVDIRAVGIIRCGRDDSAFEYVAVGVEECQAHVKRFLICRELYEMNKVIKHFEEV